MKELNSRWFANFKNNHNISELHCFKIFTDCLEWKYLLNGKKLFWIQEKRQNNDFVLLRSLLTLTRFSRLGEKSSSSPSYFLKFRNKRKKRRLSITDDICNDIEKSLRRHHSNSLWPDIRLFNFYRIKLSQKPWHNKSGCWWPKDLMTCDTGHTDSTFRIFTHTSTLSKVYQAVSSACFFNIIGQFTYKPQLAVPLLTLGYIVNNTPVNTLEENQCLTFYIIKTIIKHSFPGQYESIWIISCEVLMPTDIQVYFGWTYLYIV